jgi:hypothetical protein
VFRIKDIAYSGNINGKNTPLVRSKKNIEMLSGKGLKNTKDVFFVLSIRAMLGRM